MEIVTPMRSQSLFRLLLRKQNLIRRERGCALSLILVLFFYNCGPLAPEDWAPSMSLVLLGLGGTLYNRMTSKSQNKFSSLYQNTKQKLTCCDKHTADTGIKTPLFYETFTHLSCFCNRKDAYWNTSQGEIHSFSQTGIPAGL